MPDPQTPAAPGMSEDQAITLLRSRPADSQREILSRLPAGTKMRVLSKLNPQAALSMPGTMQPTQFPQPQPTAMGRFMNAGGNFVTNNRVSLEGGAGAIAGGMLAGPPGAVAGAAAGGADAKLAQLQSGPPVSTGKAVKEAGKSAGGQAALELGGMATGAILSRVAKSLGVSDRLMQYALKRPEDLKSGANPAEALNRYRLHANTTKQLYAQTDQKITHLSGQAEQMIQQSLPSANTIRPYATIRSVLQNYLDKSRSTLSTDEAAAIRRMISSTSSKQNQVMDIAKVNELKRAFGESVDWSKQPAQDALQAVFKTQSSARRDIYSALDNQIESAMGAQGKQWSRINDDISQLMHARDALNEANTRTLSDAKDLIPRIIDTTRSPGATSQAIHLARMLEESRIPIASTATRGAAVGTVPAIQGIGASGSHLANLISQSLSSPSGQ